MQAKNLFACEDALASHGKPQPSPVRVLVQSSADVFADLLQAVQTRAMPFPQHAQPVRCRLPPTGQ